YIRAPISLDCERLPERCHNWWKFQGDFHARGLTKCVARFRMDVVSINGWSEPFRAIVTGLFGNQLPSSMASRMSSSAFKPATSRTFLIVASPFDRAAAVS